MQVERNGELYELCVHAVTLRKRGQVEVYFLRRVGGPTTVGQPVEEELAREILGEVDL